MGCDSIIHWPNPEYTENGTVHKITSNTLHELLIEYPEAKCQPILRPISSMTEEEHEAYEMYYMSLEAQREEDHHSICEVEIAANTTQWLLSKGFDLFGLIDAGLAIDINQQKPNGNN